MLTKTIPIGYTFRSYAMKKRVSTQLNVPLSRRDSATCSFICCSVVQFTQYNNFLTTKSEKNSCQALWKNLLVRFWFCSCPYLNNETNTKKTRDQKKIHLKKLPFFWSALWWIFLKLGGQLNGNLSTIVPDNFDRSSRGSSSFEFCIS